MELSLKVSKSSHASSSFLVMNVPPHDASTIWRCDLGNYHRNIAPIAI